MNLRAEHKMRILKISFINIHDKILKGKKRMGTVQFKIVLHFIQVFHKVIF